MAASEASKVDGNTEPGTHVMVAGIVFQMAAITAFVVCGIDFLRRSRKPHLRERFTVRMHYLVLATIFSVVVIYVRSIYRTVELLEGWKGYLITTEWFFIGLDGITMVLAVVVYNFIHPGWFSSKTTAKEILSVRSDEIALQTISEACPSQPSLSIYTESTKEPR